jgi:hypothetical protein
MGYNKGPVGHMKASTENKAVGYMAEGSAAHMSALHQIDPKDGKLKEFVGTAPDKNKPRSKEDLMEEHKSIQLDTFQNAMRNFEAAKSAKTADSLSTIREEGGKRAAKRYDYNLVKPRYDGKGGEVTAAGITQKPTVYFPEGIRTSTHYYPKSQTEKKMKELESRSGRRDRDVVMKSLNILSGKR